MGAFMASLTALVAELWPKSPSIHDVICCSDVRYESEYHSERSEEPTLNHSAGPSG